MLSCDILFPSATGRNMLVLEASHTSTMSLKQTLNIIFTQSCWAARWLTDAPWQLIDWNYWKFTCATHNTVRGLLAHNSYIHPESIQFILWGQWWDAGANPSWYWARGGVHPTQETSFCDLTWCNGVFLTGGIPREECITENKVPEGIGLFYN